MRLSPLFAALLLVSQVAVAAPRDAARSAAVAGVRYFYDGKPQAARIELLNAIKADGEWPLAHALQARIYLALGDGVAAEAEIRRAIELGLPEAQIQHLLLNAWLLQGQTGRVLDASEIAGVAPVSIGYGARIRAGAAIARGDTALAAEYLGQAIRAAPLSGQLWTDIGSFRLQGGDVAGAINAAIRAVNLNPRNIDAMLLMGRLVRDQYGLVASLPWFESIIELDSVNVAAMVEAAATLGEVGRARDMLAMTRRIQAADASNTNAWYWNSANRPRSETVR